MRRSHIDNMTWSFHTSENGNSESQWPELDHRNQMRHPARKKDTNIRENDRIISLDDSEYPELGEASAKNRNSVVPRQQCLSNTDIKITIPMETNGEQKKSKMVKRYRSPERICIDLQEALENSRRSNKRNSKELSRLKINPYNRNHNPIVPGLVDRSKYGDFRKVTICISKEKKPTRLKKTIWLHRDLKAQLIIQNREEFERAKIDAVCRDVDAINFNALRITGDSDKDYIKDMGAMTLYGKDYRAKNEDNVSESCVHYRPDIIEQISNLYIQGKPLFNRLARNGNRSLPQFQNSLIENDIVQQTLSFELKDNVKEEIETTIKTEDEDFVKYSRNFREYCTNTLTKSLNESLEQFLTEIRRLQKRFHERNPNKSKYKRRYYVGLKEVCKHIELNKIKFVIVAPDLEKVVLARGLDDQVDKLLDKCKKQNVVFCFGLRRRKLGYHTHGKGLAGCIGIANYSGTEILFKSVLIELVRARNAFKQLSGATEAIIDVSKVLPEDYLPSESVHTLLTVLSPLGTCN